MTDNLKKDGVVKSIQLLKRYAHTHWKAQKSFSTAEKIFTVEQYFIKQNDHIYAKIRKEASQLVDRMQRGYYPTSMMVWWWGVSYKRVTKLFLRRRYQRRHKCITIQFSRK